MLANSSVKPGRKDIREVYLDIRDMLLAPPRICNTDGDPLVLHTMTFEIESPQAAFEALAPLAKDVSKEELSATPNTTPRGGSGKSSSVGSRRAIES